MQNYYTKFKISIAALAAFGFLFFGYNLAFASETNGTIVSGSNNGYAWSNQAGWVNFGCSNCGISIADAGITGHAWSNNYGWINMNPSNGGVTVAASGALSGYAWSSGLGWINFSGVSINSSGKFVGQASGTVIGTLTFDCTNCSVVTDYRPANFRTTTTPTPTSSGGGGGGGGGGTITQPTLTPTPVLPPTAPGLDTPSFPLGVTPSGDGEFTDGDEGDILPAQLFDIRLLVDSVNVSRIIDLVARVTFESFGRVPTPVSMTFAIHDETGRGIWSAVDTVTVETEQVFVKRFFDAPTLAPGNYTLRLTTIYNTDVKDEFEAPFTIKPKGAGWNWVPWFVGGLLLLLAILVFVWWLIMRRRKEQEKRGEGFIPPFT